MSIWFETDYIHDFHCKCGECRHSCCKGWQISISEQEYFRLIGMECSPELHHRLECAFVAPEQPDPIVFRKILPNWLGQCPMLGEDGLCMLQKECGEEVLPQVCRLYPRSLRRDGSLCHACCSGSCEAVIEILMKKDRLTFRTCSSDTSPALSFEEPDAYPKRAIDCIHIIQDRSLSMDQRLQKICDRIGCVIPDCSQLLPSVLPSMLELSPELEPYLAAEVPGDSILEENLLANHLLYTDFPGTDPRLAPAESGFGLALLLHLIRMVEHLRDEDLADALTAVFHLAEHTAFYYNASVLMRRNVSGRQPL